jgi:hypothetical protein
MLGRKKRTPAEGAMPADSTHAVVRAKELGFPSSRPLAQAYAISQI